MAVTYSVIIPAYNEEVLLPATLQALTHAMSACEADGEIIVVDNNSTDNTAEIAAGYGADVVFERVNQISRARNTGARVARGKYLLFLDADTLVSSALLQTALANLEHGNCCGGGVIVIADGPVTPALQRVLACWNWISLRFGWAAGCFIYCLQSGFKAIGGFSERVYASEEIWFSWQLAGWGKKQGLSFQIITNPGIMTSMRKLQWYSGPQIMLHALTILLFPPAVFFRRLCSSWYRRPESGDQRT